MKRHGIFIAVLTAAFLLVSCGAPKWYSDFDSAKEAAKSRRKTFIFCSAEMTGRKQASLLRKKLF